MHEFKIQDLIKFGSSLAMVLAHLHDEREHSVCAFNTIVGLSTEDMEISWFLWPNSYIEL